MSPLDMVTNKVLIFLTTTNKDMTKMELKAIKVKESYTGKVNLLIKYALMLLFSYIYFRYTIMVFKNNKLIKFLSFDH